MTPDEAERFYDAVMTAAPMALVGVVMFVIVWLWPVSKKP